MGMWTLDELVDRARAALAAEYPGAPNGRVRELPDRRSIRWYTQTGLVEGDVRGVRLGRRDDAGLVHAVELDARRGGRGLVRPGQGGRDGTARARADRDPGRADAQAAQERPPVGAQNALRTSPMAAIGARSSSS
jgi:hypothetical protein